MTARLLLLSWLLLEAVSCFETRAAQQLTATHITSRLPEPRCRTAVALAKKKSKARKPTPPKQASVPARVDVSAPPSGALSPSASSGGGLGGGSDGGTASLDSRLDEVLREAGVTRTQDDQVESMRGPADPLSRIPKKGQELLERFFGGGAIVFGSAFILSGIAVSVEAVCKVTGNALPTALDEVLVQYVEPAMTPSILILFGFSISLGLLKQLQLGSEQAGVLYVEPDDD